LQTIFFLWTFVLINPTINKFFSSFKYNRSNMSILIIYGKNGGVVTLQRIFILIFCLLLFVFLISRSNKQDIAATSEIHVIFFNYYIILTYMIYYLMLFYLINNLPFLKKKLFIIIKTRYGIMLDAGSTGSRIHIYHFEYTADGWVLFFYFVLQIMIFNDWNWNIYWKKKKNMN